MKALGRGLATDQRLARYVSKVTMYIVAHRPILANEFRYQLGYLKVIQALLELAVPPRSSCAQESNSIALQQQGGN